MNLQAIIEKLNLIVLTTPIDFASQVPTSGYAADLLSCVMAGARQKGLWITLQAHANVVAVASLLELCAVIITEGAVPEPSTIATANEKGVTLLSSTMTTYQVVGKLWEMGLK